MASVLLVAVQVPEDQGQFPTAILAQAAQAVRGERCDSPVRLEAPAPPLITHTFPYLTVVMVGAAL